MKISLPWLCPQMAAFFEGYWWLNNYDWTWLIHGFMVPYFQTKPYRGSITIILAKRANNANVCFTMMKALAIKHRNIWSAKVMAANHMAEIYQKRKPFNHQPSGPFFPAFFQPFVSTQSRAVPRPSYEGMVLLRQGLNKSQLRLSAGPGKVLFGGARITWPGQAFNS